VLLPYEFTTCTKIKIIEGDPSARVLRANIAQAALLVLGDTVVELSAHYGIPFDTDCRRADAAAVKSLGIAEAARKFPPGVGR
jgi:hypothetical protein